MSSSCATAPKRVESPEVKTSSHLFEPHGRQTLLSCSLLIVAVLVSYSAITHNGFINYDDGLYITTNPHIKAGLTWATVKWAFTTYHGANWIPLTWLFHALNCQLFALNPGPHHYVSVLLHAVNAVLLFLLLQNVTGFRWRGLTVAALFALHPINVESVAWAAELKNVLSMMFLLLGLHAYSWYCRRPAFHRYTLVFFLFVLGILSKSQIVTFPLLLVLWDYWPLGRLSRAPLDAQMTGANPAQPSVRWLILEKLPLLFISAASAIVTMVAEKAGGAVTGLARLSVPLRLETALISYVLYLKMAFWPVALVALYPRPTKLYPIWQVSGAALLLVLVTVLVLRARSRRYLAVGWFWFLGSLVPMIGLVQIGPQAMADRFAYLPFIGLFLMFTWLVSDFASEHHIPEQWLAFPASGLILALGILTYVQVGYWHDIRTFWQRTASLTQGNYVAETNLGDYFFQTGNPEEAAVHFRAALAIRSDNARANMNLAAYEESRGDLLGAIKRYETAVLLAADADARASAYASMGFDYRALGQSVKAKQCFETAESFAPDRARAMVGLGLLAQERADWAEAIRQYSRAVEVQPADVTYVLLAKALEHERRFDDAKAAAAHAQDPAEAQKEAELFLSKK